MKKVLEKLFVQVINRSAVQGNISNSGMWATPGTKEGNSKGGENDGRLLIGLYYSAVTGNRKQVLTGSSENCEHKCRWNTLSFKLQVLFES